MSFLLKDLAMNLDDKLSAKDEQSPYEKRPQETMDGLDHTPTQQVS